MNPYEELSIASNGYSIQEVERFKTLSTEDRVKIMRAVLLASKDPKMSPQSLQALFDESGHPSIASNCLAAFLLGKSPFRQS